MTRKSAGWDLRTNLKNKPAAQGTLFSGGKEQMPDAKRYPRGYTPERQREVLDSVRIEAPAATGVGKKSKRDIRRVAEVLKRSSVPASDLKGLGVAVMPPEVAQRHGMGLQDADGNYRATVKRVDSETGKPYASAGVVALRPDATAFTILHEVGHHASATSGTEHSSYNTARKRGEEEGFADVYAEQHMPPPLKHLRKKNALESIDQGLTRGLASYQPRPHQSRGEFGLPRPDEFKAGYDAVRPYEARVPNKEDQRQASDRAWLRTATSQLMLPGMSNTDRLYREGVWA